MGIADFEKYSDLFDALVKNCRCTKDLFENKDIHHSNIIIGLIIRETLLLERGYAEQVVEECKEILYKMAVRTGTLWENVDIRASCNHNVASYFAVVLMYALTGYRGFKNNVLLFNKKTAGINCEFEFEYCGKAIKISVQDYNQIIETNYNLLYN